MFLFQFKAKRFINKVQKVTKILILLSRVKSTFDKKKDFFFKQGPKKGVEKFLRALNYRRRKNQIISGNIIGILVAINGRWSKTKNGRSQELKFSFGRVQKSKLVSFSQHAYSCGKTKFGAFNVSVILCLKKTV